MTKYERICQPLVAVVSCGLNIPPIVLGLIASANWCPYYGRFLAPNAVLCFVNIGAAFYSIYNLRSKVKYDLRYNAHDHDESSESIFGRPAATATVEVEAGHAQQNVSDEQEESVSLEAAETTAAAATEEYEGAVLIVAPSETEGNEKDGHSGVELNMQAPTTKVDTIFTPTAPETTSIQLQPEAEDDKTDNHRRATMTTQTASTDNALINYAPHSCFRRCLKLRTTSSNRIRHLVCYNGLITTYGILFLFWAFWLGGGEQLVLLEDVVSDDRLDGCSERASEYQFHYVTTSVVVGYGESRGNGTEMLHNGTKKKRK